MMHNALRFVQRDLHHGSGYPWRMESAADRLRFARERAGYETAKAAAEAMGVSVSTYIQHENGSRGFPAGRAERYATFFRTTPEWLLYGRGEAPEKSKPAPVGLRPITRLVPVIGVVQAGLWQEVIEDEPEPEELLPINLKGFEGAQLFALRVSGNSMNLFYPDGCRVVVCPAEDIGIREGDHVVVRRRRGGLVETTLKEVVQEKDGVALWPRSTDPRYQDPVRLKTVRDADEGPEIIAVVVAMYTVRPMQSRPLIQL
jgi:SOS-response transcriptional repressor LexA